MVYNNLCLAERAGSNLIVEYRTTGAEVSCISLYFSIELSGLRFKEKFHLLPITFILLGLSTRCQVLFLINELYSACIVSFHFMEFSEFNASTIILGFSITDLNISVSFAMVLPYHRL